MTLRLKRGDVLVVATHNPGKLVEIRDLLDPFGLAAKSAAELGLPEPAETGETFEENARLKAVLTAYAAGSPALADNSGLAVEALGGAPGVHSARWAGEPRDFQQAMARVEEQLQARGAASPAARKAKFVCMLCLANPLGAVQFFEGTVEGHLVWPPRGNQGFGYDPMFVPPAMTRHSGRWTPQRSMQFRTGHTPSPPSEPQSSTAAAARPDAGAGVSGPLAIYIHWPYCQSKCPYCDFNSHATRSISEDEYLKAALAELGHYAAETEGRTVTSIFFGGGTPSLMAPATAASLLEAAALHWPIDRACEITLEANPSSVETRRFAGFRSAGVNRVSVGVQSLHDDALRFLGRLHTAGEAREALGIATRHFERVSFDLIYARPGQTAADWRAELSAALGLARGHLSLYQLTIEPGTAFFGLHKRGKLRIPGAKLAAGLYELTQEICEAAGLPAYEVSNHAAPGEESRHNLTYWRYGDYLGIGPGAHGRIASGGSKIATAAIKAPAAWAAQIFERGQGCAERYGLSAREQAEEMVLMGLRLREGIDCALLEARTGYGLAPAEAAALEADGLLVRDGASVRVSKRGRLVLNAVAGTLAAGLTAAPRA